MTAFADLSVSLQYTLTGLVFLAATVQLFLCIHRVSLSRKLRSNAGDIAVLVLLYGVSVLLSASSFTVNVPWLLIGIPTLLWIGVAFCRIGVANHRQKQTILPASIKQALDNLDMGIMFCDDMGRAVLTNRQMAALVINLSGAYPQTLPQVQAAFDDAVCINKKQQLYQMADNSVWRLQLTPLSTAALKGFLQVTAQDVSALYQANQSLAQENEALKATNDEMQLMLERLADRIREQETLALKTQIHSDIGASLIALSNLMKNDADGDVDTALFALQNALRYFSNNRVNLPSAGLQSTLDEARALGVTVNICGDTAASESLLAAAIKECVTNCVNHAGGDTVDVNITMQNTMQTITITNNGTVPDGPIQEGGGLTSLRKLAEGMGAAMTTAHIPTFALILTLGEAHD